MLSAKNMSNFAVATSYRPTPELINQLFIKFHKNSHLQILAFSVSASGSYEATQGENYFVYIGLKNLNKH